MLCAAGNGPPLVLSARLNRLTDGRTAESRNESEASPHSEHGRDTDDENDRSVSVCVKRGPTIGAFPVRVELPGFMCTRTLVLSLAR